MLTWLLGFGAIVYLGLKGGGYDPLVHDQVGIVAWWLMLGLVAVGALPRRRPGTIALCALGLVLAFLAWTALSLVWTESAERTLADLARICGYVGFFALAVLSREAGGARRMVAALACGIAAIAIVALLSRLHPAWFPSVSNQTGTFLPGAQERLSYPINYWNGLAGLLAIGVPLMLQLATDARTVAVRALAAAAIPAILLTIYFTLSRAGIAAAIAAAAVFFAFTSDRLPKLATAAVAAAGGGVLIAVASSHFALVHGLPNSNAEDQGNGVLALTIVVCLAVGLIAAGIALIGRRLERPAWTSVSKPASLRILLVAGIVVVVAGLALDAPNRGADAWNEFKNSTKPLGGAQRLGSVAGESRYAIWSSAVREMQSEPLTGTGAGTFEYWWNRDGTVSETVVDTHSLYLQTLGELGVVGFLLLAAFLLVVLAGGIVATRVVSAERRVAVAAALAGCSAFCVSALFDWVWQIPALAVATLLLAATLVTTDRRDADRLDRATGLPTWPRLGAVAAALVAIVVIAMPLASTSLIRRSQDEAREGDVAAALADARTAENVEPSAATPRLQQALLLEREDEARGRRRVRALGDREGGDELAQLAHPLANRSAPRARGRLRRGLQDRQVAESPLAALLALTVPPATAPRAHEPGSRILGDPK